MKQEGKSVRQATLMGCRVCVCHVKLPKMVVVEQDGDRDGIATPR